MLKKQTPEAHPKQLRELLHYEPETGALTWKPRSGDLFPEPYQAMNWNSRWANKPAFTFRNREGYYQGTLLQRPYLAHRVIWAWMTGAWPIDEIDHINRNPSDNRWANLRVVNRSQQVANTIALPRGVERNLQGYGPAYRARILVRGSSRYLGTFDTPEEAHQAYQKAAKTHRDRAISAPHRAAESTMKLKIPKLDPAQLRELMDYDPETGELTWKPKPGIEWQISWNVRHAGKPALAASNGKYGHRTGQLFGKKVYAHRVIWAWMTGSWSEKEIDHINGDTSDNRWCNLREVNDSQQGTNRSSRKRDLPRGVYRNNQIGGLVYIAAITINKRWVHLGAFATPEEAHQAYLAAAEKRYGEHAYHLSRNLKP